MKIRYYFIALTVLFFACQPSQSSKDGKESQEPEKGEGQKGPITMVIHGGAGNIKRKHLTEEEQKVWKQKLKTALNKGYQVLQNGGEAVKAVEAAIKTMENDSFFNAGKGSVLTHQGEIEMDASMMRGANKKAGAMASVTNIKNPIKGARAVMEESKHVMLVSDGAEKFAKEQGLTMKDSAYFWTHSRYKSLQKVLKKEKSIKGKDGIPQKTLGTVGALALDKKGNLAAGTSTGGMTNKKYGRVGDSPLIGAGTYADNTSCAVSATGHGEYFIRNVVAYDVGAHMKYRDMPLKKAADTVIHHKLKALGGKGGIIGLDQAGNYTGTFNTNGMFRAFKQKGEALTVKIF